MLSAAALVIAPSAVAGDDESARGGCGAGSTWKLRVVDDDAGRLMVIGSVYSDDENVWDWRMKHNDDVSAKGDLRARDTDRSLRIERSMVNLRGSDDIIFRAENNRTGEVCRGELTF